MIPKIAIVGRPNVGKSSLLNLLADRRISIVDPTAGVTRDRVSTVVELPPAGPQVELIDTGGYGVEDVQNLTADIERQISLALREAHLILFVVDSQTGVVPLDREVAQLIRTTVGETPVLLVANKVDSPTQESYAWDAVELGFGEPIMVSAANGHLKHGLADAIREALSKANLQLDGKAPDPGILLAIVGKRNAGKSTLVNALAGDERVIVSEQEGTTRDSIDVRFEMDGMVFTAIDTAGVRRRRSLQDDIEYYSYHRALRSVRRADVVLFIIDATVPISQVDHQLFNEILNHFKPVVVVVNKWDLVKDKTTDEFLEYFDKELKGANFAPFIFISAKDQEGIRDTIGMALNLHKQASHRVPTAELNRVMEQVLKDKPPSSKSGRTPRVYYITQLAVNPPTIGMFVNNPSYFDNNYQRYLLNSVRDLLPFSEVPIKLLIRDKKKRGEEEESQE